MAAYEFLLWKKNPFIKLLLPSMAGILVQWNFQINPWILRIVFLICIASMTGFFFIPFFRRFRLSFFNGVSITILFFSFGALLTWQKDIRHDKNWVGNIYKENDAVVVNLIEPLVEKTKSFKADASVSYLIEGRKVIPAKGKVILYFKKDTTSSQLGYGSQIIFQTGLQEIKNSGNPGGFDYRRYSLFHGITHEVFLQSGKFAVLNEKKENGLGKFLFNTRNTVLTILRQNIKSEKELGLAEALLIGYKDDLDRTLVQSYTNTGVVHIIAISGLHLGLIYWLLIKLFKPIRKRKNIKWLRPISIVIGLWIFSLLAGAQASVLRSAVMFSCIVLAESLNRKTSIYNTMAFSAFILLCINPYWLWDVGFQLSYTAVLSIVIFMRPIYSWFYFPNKAVDFIWKLNAVTIAAQILTVPLSVYHFHQFPNYFMLTNFVAVPLSSVIVLAEIFLCAISYIPVLAILTGKILILLINLMDGYIERIEALPFSLWDGLQINIIQAILLIAFATAVSYWLMEKAKNGLRIGLMTLLGFTLLRSYSFVKAGRQKKIIVYNVPGKKAIDFINGRSCVFVGDTGLLSDHFLRNFHLNPSRVLHRITGTCISGEHVFKYCGKNVLLLDSTVSLAADNIRPVINLLVISKNPKLYISKLSVSFNIKQMVFDGSVPAWKVNYWKKDCEALHIPYYDVASKGAFVMNFN